MAGAAAGAAWAYRNWSAEPAELGQIVFAASASQQGARLTWGTVSATDRTFRGPHRRPITGAIEHTAPLPRGASGGVVVDRTGVRVLRDPYSAKPYVLFYTTKRVGGGVQDFDAIKLLKYGVS